MSTTSTAATLLGVDVSDSVWVDADKLVILSRLAGLTMGSGTFLASSVDFLAVFADGLRMGTFVRDGREAMELAEEDFAFFGSMVEREKKGTNWNSIDTPSC